MKIKGILAVILVIMFINVCACYDEEGRKHNEFFAANKQYINSIHEKLKNAKKGDLIEMRDDDIWVITNLPNYFGKKAVEIEKMNKERIGRFISNKELCFNIIRIIKPEDPDYPEKAKQFLIEK